LKTKDDDQYQLFYDICDCVLDQPKLTLYFTIEWAEIVIELKINRPENEVLGWIIAEIAWKAAW
jgi:hypothetical protein